MKKEKIQHILLRALPMASAMERYRQDVLENGGLTRWTT